MPTLAIARFSAVGAAVLALALPTIASAQGKCPEVRAMLADDISRLTGLGVTINDKGLVDVTLGGLAVVVRDATNCDLFSPVDGFEITCQWHFATGEKQQAIREFDKLRTRLDDCLPLKLERREPLVISDERLAEMGKEYGPSFVENVRTIVTLQDYDARIDLDEEQSLDVSLDLHHKSETGTSWISARFSRD